MDDPGSDEVLLHRTLRQFSLINCLLSRNRGLSRTYLFSHMRSRKLTHCSVLDVGAGGGDYGRWLRKEGQRWGIDVHVTLLDSDPRVISYLHQTMPDDPGITVIQGSILDLGSMSGAFDYVFANHFLHHLPDEKIPDVVRCIDKIANQGFLINDLVRSHTSLFFFTLFGLIFLPRSFALADGRQSIRRAFRREEISQLLGPLPEIRIGTAKPGRLFLYRFK